MQLQGLYIAGRLRGFYTFILTILIMDVPGILCFLISVSLFWPKKVGYRHLFRLKKAYIFFNIRHLVWPDPVNLNSQYILSPGNLSNKLLDFFRVNIF